MYSTKFTKFSSPTKLFAGNGSIKFLVDEIQQVDVNTMLIVTDHGIKKSGILDEVQAVIESMNVETVVFDKVKPNPDIDITDQGYRSLKNKNINLILAVGGGSVLDSAKALAILLANGGSIGDYFGIDQYEKNPAPILAVPTTVGTGSEVGRGAIITENKTKMKKVVAGESLYPQAAFLDAALLKGMPGHLVASTGMDALTHAIEAYVSKNSSMTTDAITLHAIRSIGSAIRPATASSDNSDAMNAMLQASAMAGIGMTNAGLGMVHGISHAIGGQYDAPHGIVNAIMLPYVMEYNWIANAEKFSNIAEALRVDTNGNSVENNAKAVVEYVKGLAYELGIPKKLSAIGVDDAKLDLLADIAFNDAGYMEKNPRRLTREDIYNILKSAV